MMKRFYIVGIIFLVLAFAFGCAPKPAPTPAPTPAPAPPPAPAPTPAPPKPITMKYATYAPEVIVPAKVIKAIMGEIESRSEGRIKTEIYWSGTMASQPEIPGFLTKNIAQGGAIGVSGRPDLFPLSRGVELIYLTEKPEALALAIAELFKTYPPLAKEFEELGIKPLFFSFPLQVPLPSTKPAYKWEDMRGWKIRSAGSDAETISRWGATPVSIPFPETYEALERGLIDSSCAIFFTSHAGLRLPEVCDYTIDTGAGFFVLVVESLSLEFYNSLPEDLQKVMDSVADDSLNIWRGVYTGGAQFVAGELAPTQMEFIRWTDEEMLRAKEQALPEVHDVWFDEMEERGLGAEAQELFELFTALIEKYEPEATLPYPFDLVKQARQ